MNFFEWLGGNWELVCILFGIFVNALGLAYNVVKYLRSGGFRRAEQRLAILEAARQYECEAEAMENYTGAEKLQYVLSRLRSFTAEMNVAFDEGELTSLVEADIAFSKRVNADKSEALE